MLRLKMDAIHAAHHDAALPGCGAALFMMGVIGVLTRRNVVIV
jgi:NADH:ubiquinone oxidoreductase subunit K